MLSDGSDQTPMEREQPAAIREALNRLWAQFLPQIEERVATLERAAKADAEGTLSPELCEQAGAAAHKLAGTLGTFGLEAGTELAREAEVLLGRGVAATQTNGGLEALAAELRATLARRK
jgi:HPt (histidine-containing phosphotransfer) domain-containing protein